MMATSPYRDPTREGGWMPWLERLAPLVTSPPTMEWVEFEMGSGGSARTTAYELRKKIIDIPRGRWKFTAQGSTIRVVFLGKRG